MNKNRIQERNLRLVMDSKSKESSVTLMAVRGVPTTVLFWYLPEV